MAFALCLWGIVLLGAVVGVAKRFPTGLSAAILLIAAVCALGLRLIPTGFYGLEYEDAYVYAAASKFESASATRPSDSAFTVTVCAAGSLYQCVETEGYPGHLAGYTALLTAVTSLIGYEPWIYPAIGAFLSTLTVLCVWWASVTLTRSKAASLWSATLMAVTPTLVVYGGSAVSETASAFLLAVWCGSTAEAVRGTDEGDRVRAGWLAIALVAAALAALVRRENIICLPLLLTCVGFSWWRRRTSVDVWRAAGVALVILVPIAFLVAQSLVSEVGEYGAFSFSLRRALEVTPTVGLALGRPGYFGMLAWLALLGIFFGSRATLRDTRHVHDVLTTCIFSAVAVWVISYGSHVCSTYQLAGATVQPFDFLRYLSNAGPFLCVLASVGIASVIAMRPFFVHALIGLAAVGSALSALSLRGELAEVERRVRTEPALAGAAAAHDMAMQFPVVTMESLVLQLHAPSALRVVSLPELSGQMLQQLGGTVLYIEQDMYDNPVDKKRFARGFAALPERVQLLRSGTGWRVWLLRQRPE